MIGNSLVRFSLVGVAGFVVDTGVLYLTRGALGPYLGRLVSFFSAVVATWLLNRSYTFGQRTSQLPLLREFGRYFVAMLGGGAVNYCTYAVLVAGFPLFYRWPVLAVGAGSLAGLAVNFLSARFLIFAKAADPIHEDEQDAP